VGTIKIKRKTESAPCQKQGQPHATVLWNAGGLQQATQYSGRAFIQICALCRSNG